MNVEGAMHWAERTEREDGDRAAEALKLLRGEVVRLERMLRLAGHAYLHDNRPSFEVLGWWKDNL